MKKFLSVKEFKIKAKVLDFSSTQYMTDLEKKKIYIGFMKLLNNHFKWSCFNKDLYQHFTSHCGFSAHYNIYGFYGEYFATAASFHFNVNEYATPMHECMGNVNRKSTLSRGEQFYAIYEEMNGMRSGIGEFYDKIMKNQNWGGYSDYADLDRAIKDALSEYKILWIQEIKKAIKVKEASTPKEEKPVSDFTRIKEVAESSLGIITRVKAAVRTTETEPKIAFIKEAPMETKTVIVDKQPLKTGQTSIFDFFDLGGVA